MEPKSSLFIVRRRAVSSGLFARMSQMLFVAALGAGCFQVGTELVDCAVPCTDSCIDGYECREGLCVALGSSVTCARSAIDVDCSSECAEGCVCSAGACIDEASGESCLMEPPPSDDEPPPRDCDCEDPLCAGAPATDCTGVTTPSCGECAEGCECSVGICRVVGSEEPCPPPPAAERPEITTAVLRAACNGLPYAADLVATGGQPPYTWELLQSSFVLVLDSETGHLSGVPAGAGPRNLSIKVKDSLGVEDERTILLDVRALCGFAYISRETGPLRLWAVDTLSISRRSFPVNAAEADQVFDFEFSPDGRYLAFRAGPDTTSARLHLLLFDADSDQVLPFDRPVLDYAWSKSGQYLAVVLEGEETDVHLLSGLDVEATDRPWGEHAVTYRTELQWLDDSSVVFQGQTVLDIPGLGLLPVPDTESPYVARRLDEGFAPPRQLSAIQESAMRLYSAPAGIVTKSEAANLIRHVAIGLSVDDDLVTNFAHPTPMIWSDDRRYLGRIDGESRLEVLSLTQSQSLPAVGSSRCDALLVRRTMPDRERFICLDEGATNCAPEEATSGVLRVVDFYPASNRLEELTVADCFQASGAQANPRTISQDGDWLVFDIGGMFSVVGLDDGSIGGISLFEDSNERAYAFSPDSTRLLWQLGGSLSLWTLDSSRDAFDISAPDRLARAPEPCVTDFVDSEPSWCGHGNSTHARWAPDSQSIAYETDGGVLWLADVSVIGAPAIVRQVSATATCPDGCVIRYAFQPSP